MKTYLVKNGTNGVGIVWLGEFATAPLNPVVNNAFKNTTVGIAYIWDGSFWQEMVHDGLDGENAFIYIASATDISGGGFEFPQNAALPFVAVLSTTVFIPSPIVTDFVGLWRLLNATNGLNGASAYVYQASADDNIGTGFTYPYDPAQEYRAIINTDTEIVTPIVTDFAGAWFKAEATNGTDGLNADMTRLSKTSLLIEIANKTFDFLVTSDNIGWGVGTRLRASNTGGGGVDFMEGICIFVDNTQVIISVDLIGGSGTISSWNISIAGEKGTNGSDATVNATNIELVLDAASADTLADADTINFNKSSVLKKITWANFKVALNSLYVRIASPKFTADVNLVGTYKYYRCTSDTADTIDDDRSYYSGHIVVYEKCTVANVAKGGGTWVEYARLSGSNTGDQSLTQYLLQNGSKLSGTASGTDTYAVALTPTLTAYADTNRFYIKFTNANTTAATLNIDTLGAKAIKKNVSTALVAGDILAGQVLCLAYDGTNFQIISPVASLVAKSHTAGDEGTIIKSTGEAGGTKFLRENGDGTCSWQTPAVGGSSMWTLMPGTPTRTGNTTFTCTGDLTTYVAKCLIIKWTEAAAVKVGMVSIPSTYGAPNTTITIIGDTMASIDAGSLKYCLLGAEMFKKEWAVAGTLGATGTDIARAIYATEPMAVFGSELQHGTAGVTTTFVIDINKNGTTMYTAKPSLATTVASSPTPFTADSGTRLALGDKTTVDIDTINTGTLAIDLYVQQYEFPLRLLNLT